MTGLALAPGLVWYPAFLDRVAQASLLRDVQGVLDLAPPFRPTMPRSGKPFSVRMTNCGPLGWVSDAAGYRYQATHPDTGRPWPPMPPALLAAWDALAPGAPAPEACLVNLYEGDARMGLHQDRDEADLCAPVVSLSLGATCVFRHGGSSRGDPTRSIKLASGDALVIGGPSRLAFHGVDRLLPGTSTLLPGDRRINLTVRRVGGPGSTSQG